MTTAQHIGTIGGTGQLGGAIALALLRNRLLAPGQLWISSRSGNNPLLEETTGVRTTIRNQELVDACQKTRQIVFYQCHPDLRVLP